MTSLPKIPQRGKPLGNLQKELIKFLAEITVREMLEHDTDLEAGERRAVAR